MTKTRHINYGGMQRAIRTCLLLLLLFKNILIPTMDKVFGGMQRAIKTGWMVRSEPIFFFGSSMAATKEKWRKTEMMVRPNGPFGPEKRQL